MQLEDGRKLRMRRAQWRDFDAVAALVAECAAGELPPDRHTKRRFRRIVHDLGNDLYLAFAEQALVGLVHIVYVRELVAPRRAELAALLLAPALRCPEGYRLLVQFACMRARKRDCGVIIARLRTVAAELDAVLAGVGFESQGAWVALRLEPDRRFGQEV